MRIIHLSDLHYGKNNSRIERMFSVLIDKIDKLNQERKIDLIVFSGDLVHSGNNETNFNEAEENFILPLLNKLNMSKDNFIMTQGNHDNTLDEKEIKIVQEHIDRFDTNKEVDDFVSKEDLQFNLSFEKSNNYYKFISNFYDKDEIHKLNQIFIRDIHNKKIGIVSFNSSWRAFIGDHSNKLLIPKSIVNRSIKAIKNCDLSIALMHHPIEDLRNFNQFEIEDLIHENFHILLTGHYHKHKPSILFSSNTGILKLSSMALMSEKDGSENGFTILDLDLNTFEVEIKKNRYINSDNIFTITQEHTSNIPVNKEKEREVKIYKQTKFLFEKSLIDANALIIFNKEERAERSFLDYYNEPIIKDKSYFEDQDNSRKNITLDIILSDNYIVLGKDKAGKTSLLRKIQLELLQNYFIHKKICIYIEFKNSYDIKRFDIVDYLRQNLSVNKAEADLLIQTEKFHFLIDNYNSESKQQKEFIISLLSSVQNYTLTITSIETQESLAHGEEFHFNNISLKKCYIHPLNRKCIRTQTEKILHDYDKDEREKIVSKVLSIFSQLNIPYNYWSLSLFLWIYKKDRGININDNIEMIILYVDKLLGREEIASLGQDDYDLFKKFFANLSYELLTKHNDSNYSISYHELTHFIEEFKNKNIRFVTDIKELLDYLLEKGILRKNSYTDRYTFRLNGVMEYFTAVYMYSNEDFVNQLLSEENEMLYLEFSNELEILSGLARGNEKYLIKILEKTKKTLSHINEKYTENYDTLLRSKMSSARELARLFKEMDVNGHAPVSLEEQDDMMDNIKPIQTFQDDVKVKNPQKRTSSYSHSQLEKYLFILSRVFRSMSSIDDKNLMLDTFNFILNSYINLGFELLNEFEFQKEKSEKEIEKEILGLFSNFIPLVTQLMLSDAILHVNLKRLIEEQIADLETDGPNNQYKLTILYFMLLDIDLKKNGKLVEKMIDNFDLLPLKNTALLKLYLYLNFGSYGNKILEDFLKEKIINLQKALNPDANEDKIRNKIDKIILIQKNNKK